MFVPEIQKGGDVCNLVDQHEAVIRSTVLQREEATQSTESTECIKP